MNFLPVHGITTVMLDPAEVQKMVEKEFPEAKVEVGDLTGTFDHFQIKVSSPRFLGKSLVEQHRMVQASVQEALNDGRIHAIKIKTTV